MNIGDLTELPAEVNRMFLGHLNGRQRISVQRVCRLWAFLGKTFPNAKFRATMILKNFEDLTNIEQLKAGKINELYRYMDGKHEPVAVSELEAQPGIPVSRRLEVDDSPDTEEKIKCLLEILENNNINNIDTVNFNEGTEFSDEFNAVFIEFLENNGKIKNLHFEKSYLGIQFFSELSKINIKLDTLSIVECNLNNPHAKSIAKIISSNIVSQSLDLSRNNFYGDAISEICKALKEPNVALNSLDLSCNFISNGEITEIAEALKENISLEHLYISHNYENKMLKEFSDDELTAISADAITAFAEALKVNTNLKELDFQSCRLNNDCVKILAEALKQNQHLECLRLMGNSKITQRGLNYLREVRKNCFIDIVESSKILKRGNESDDELESQPATKKPKVNIEFFF